MAIILVIIKLLELKINTVNTWVGTELSSQSSTSRVKKPAQSKARQS